MRMLPLLLLLWVASFAWSTTTSHASHAATWTPVKGIDARALSGDGRTVVGSAGPEVARWTEAGGVELLGSPEQINGPYATSVSFDGAVLAVESSSPGVWVWSEAAGFVLIPPLPGAVASAGAFVSDDGSVVAATSLLPGAILEAALYDVATQELTGLGFLPDEYPYSTTRGTNTDGSVVIGDLGVGNGFKAGRWSAGTGWESLGVRRSSNDTTPDGTVVVGGADAWRWTEEGGLEDLGRGEALAVDASGTRIVGDFGGSYSSNSLGFVWTPETGHRDLNEVVKDLGLDLGPLAIESGLDISNDGRTVLVRTVDVQTQVIGYALLDLSAWPVAMPLPPLFVLGLAAALVISLAALLRRHA